MKSNSIFTRGNCLPTHRIGIISAVHEGERKRAQRRICAWCTRVIQEGGDPVTHGICTECEKKETLRYREEIKPFAGVPGRNH